MIISKSMNTKLNEQITAEFSAAQSYLAMSCAFEGMSLTVLAKLFHGQYEEESEHGLKILKYVQQVGGTVVLDAIAKPKATYSDAKSIVQAALKSEENVSGMINDLVALADSEKDYATRSFLNWFVDEQVEEVSSMTDLLNLVELADGNMLQVEARVRHQMAAAAS